MKKNKQKKKNPIAKMLLTSGLYKGKVVKDKKKYDRKSEKPVDIIHK